MKDNFTTDDLIFLTSKFKTQIERSKFIDNLDYYDKCEYIIFIALSNRLDSPLYLENGDFYDVDTGDCIYRDDAIDFDPNFDENHDITITEYADMLNTEQTDFKDKIFKVA